jgi:hypothetical protein
MRGCTHADLLNHKTVKQPGEHRFSISLWNERSLALIGGVL